MWLNPCPKEISPEIQRMFKPKGENVANIGGSMIMSMKSSMKNECPKGTMVIMEIKHEVIG